MPTILQNNCLDLDSYCPPEIKLQNAFKSAVKEYPEETLCLLNINTLRENVRRVIAGFLQNDEDHRDIAYAVKANPHPLVLETLISEGINTFDCASDNEILQILEMLPDAKILFNHPVKRSKDIALAREHNVNHFTVQTSKEIFKILGFPSDQTLVDPNAELEISVRLNTQNKTAAIDLSKKFGVSMYEAKIMIRAIQALGLKSGLSIHTGSQNTDPSSYKDGILSMANVVREFGGISTMNIGGGLPVNHLNSEKSKDFDLSLYFDSINRAIRLIKFDNPNLFLEEHKIIIEPGRSIVASAVDLVIPILEIRRSEGVNCAYIYDGIFTSFSDMYIHNWRYHFDAMSSTNKTLSDNRVPWHVFGRTCDSGDDLGEICLPKNIDAGDYIWVPNAGAYMTSQASAFNGFSSPRYVPYNS